jgi:hypothetical protein
LVLGVNRCISNFWGSHLPPSKQDCWRWVK